LCDHADVGGGSLGCCHSRGSGNPGSKLSSGLRPRIYNCGSRTAGEVLFFARAKKSTQKKARPDGANTPLRFSPVPARAPTRRAPTTRLGLEHEARDFSGTGCDARARHTGWKRTPVAGFEVGCSDPRSARRVPQPERGISSEPLFESSRVVGGRRVGERPLGRGTEEGVARSGVCFFWLLFFAQAKKSNLPWVSHPQVCVAAGDTKSLLSSRANHPKPGFPLSRE
jgi:hypothetical protein